MNAYILHDIGHVTQSGQGFRIVEYTCFTQNIRHSLAGYAVMPGDTSLWSMLCAYMHTQIPKNNPIRKRVAIEITLIIT